MSRTVIDVSVPGDKSITHRALVLAAMADGESRLTGLLDAADTRATARALRALGVDAPSGALGETVIPGRGLGGLRSPGQELACGNSGTTARFLLGALAGCELDAVITGDASLRKRPMRRVTEPLAALGARYEELGEPDRLPIRVRGTQQLAAIDVMNARSSAQVKTAMLLAGLNARVPVRVTEQEGPRDHTERLLGAMGAATRTAATADACVVHLEPPDRLDPLDLRVPGDISSAAFFLGLAALRGPIRLRGVGLNPTRTGALDVLERMGATVTVEHEAETAGEPVGDVVVSPGRLQGTVVRAAEVPTLLDEIPLLAVVAARAEGETRFEGVAELRVKESDRVAALARNLQAVGVHVEEKPDSLTVQGTTRRLEGLVDAFGDHRIAMAFGVLGTLADAEIQVEGGDAVAVSYPGFWDALARVTRELEAT